MNKAVFLDRDGVLNEIIFREGKPTSPREIGEFRLLPGVNEALRALKDRGFLVFVITNQPEIARGTLTVERLREMHHLLSQTLSIDKIYVCMHNDGDGCECRKPKPGLLLRGAEEWEIDLGASYMVGDRWKDIEAGATAGCTTILVKSPCSGEPSPGEPVQSDYVVENLLEAAKIIVSKRGDPA